MHSNNRLQAGDRWTFSLWSKPITVQVKQVYIAILHEIILILYIIQSSLYTKDSIDLKVRANMIDGCNWQVRGPQGSNETLLANTTHSFINKSSCSLIVIAAFYCNIWGNVKQMFKLKEWDSVYRRPVPHWSNSTEKKTELLCLCSNLVSITCEIVVSMINKCQIGTK